MKDMMTKYLPLLTALLLTGCAALDRDGPYSPVADVRYTALGHDPFWLLTIGDDSIVLTLGPEGGRADGGLDSYAYPRVLPRDADGARIWESADGGGAVRIEARPGSCEGSAGRIYADTVRVRLDNRDLAGCGGRLLTGRDG